MSSLYPPTFSYSLLCFVVSVLITTSVCSADVIKSNAVTRVRLPESTLFVNYRKSRHRRDTFNMAEEQNIVDLHNAYRRMEGASDMEMMIWSDYLADMAAEWAVGCRFEHGQPPRDPASLPYNPIGQNLFAITGAKLDLKTATYAWYEEKSFYTYGTGACVSGKQCGHYTQVVWSKSREVGCAFAHCPVLFSSNLRNAHYLVCNYGPAGNYVGQLPFVKGRACSSCPDGTAWCNDGLCNRNCFSSTPLCHCAAECKNCGRVQKDTCRCQCTTGWYGNDCSVVCDDYHPYCGANPGWPTSWCNHASYGETVRSNCPALCKLCVKGVSNTACQNTTGSTTPSRSSRNPVGMSSSFSTSSSPTTTFRSSRNPVRMSSSFSTSPSLSLYNTVPSGCNINRPVLLLIGLCSYVASRIIPGLD